MVSTVNQAEGLPLVIDSTANAVIVISKNPSVAATYGARMLTEHIFQITGVKLKIYRDNELGNVSINNGIIKNDIIKNSYTYLLVGESSITNQLGFSTDNLGPGGILIKTTGNVVALIGPDNKTPTDPMGSKYAVTTFLQDFLGVMYLWPGELGKVVPKADSLLIPQINISYTPPVAQRRIRILEYNSRLQDGLNFLKFTKEEYQRIYQSESSTLSFDGGWSGWNRLGGDLGLVSGHAFGDLHAKYGIEHPEWFALQPDDTRIQHNSGRARLCKSNLELIDAIVQDKIEEIRKNPTVQSISLSPNDGGPDSFCMCDHCMALDPPEGRKIILWDHKSSPGTRMEIEYVSLTDRIVWFSNRIAEKVTVVYPNIRLVVDAYSAYTAPPLKNKLHPNIIIRFVGNSWWYDGEYNRQFSLDDWDGWGKKTNSIFWRPNLLLYAYREGTLGVYTKKLSQDFNYIAHNGLYATDFDGGLNNWGTQGLNYYILARLCWNPDLKVDEVIEEYCKAGFGNGWQYIKKYYARIEEISNHHMETNPFNPYYSVLYNDEVVQELSELLDIACAEAKKDANYDINIGKRIDFLQVGLKFTALQGKIYRLLENADNGEKSDQYEAIKLLNTRYDMMRDIFTNHHWAVNVAYVVWREGNIMRKLGWVGPINKIEDDEEVRLGL